MADNPTPRVRHYPPLTGLRFVAASAVLLYHFGAGYLQRNGAPYPIVTLLENGFLGVSLFFILSGFILTHTYREATINGRFLGVFALGASQYLSRLSSVPAHCPAFPHRFRAHRKKSRPCPFDD